MTNHSLDFRAPHAALLRIEQDLTELAGNITDIKDARALEDIAHKLENLHSLMENKVTALGGRLIDLQTPKNQVAATVREALGDRASSTCTS